MLVSAGRLRLVRDRRIRLGWVTPVSPVSYTHLDVYKRQKLLLAPGAKPTVPVLSGVDIERVFTLRTVEDTLHIRRFVEDQKPKTAVLAGGGFIGLETVSYTHLV